MFRLRWPHPPARLTSSASGARASEPRQLPGVVDQKQVARIMEIFPDKVLRRKLELDFVIADHARRKSHPLGSFHGQLVPVAQGYVQINRFWLDVRVCVSNALPFARQLPVCSIDRLNHHRQQDQATYRQSICLHHDTSPIASPTTTTIIGSYRPRTEDSNVLGLKQALFLYHICGPERFRSRSARKTLP